jgi:hypothetical protein
LHEDSGDIGIHLAQALPPRKVASP